MRSALTRLCAITLMLSSVTAADWRQLQGGPLRSGNQPSLALPEELQHHATFAMSDAILAAPVISGNVLYVVDGSGLVAAFDLQTMKQLWQYQTSGGPGNCNNTAAPAVVGDWLHVATTAGYYYVLNRHDGSLVRRIDCQDSISAAPVVGNNRVYFATLGAVVHALEPDGSKVWSWDFVREVVGFQGDRWLGSDWLKERGGRVTWRDHFVSSRDLCLTGDTIVIPAGGRTVFLRDAGEHPELRTTGVIPNFAGSEYPATFGQSADEQGRVFVQWHRRDNAGRVEVLKLTEANELETSFVPGTQTAIDLPGLLSFAAVAVRGDDVYRVKPEFGLGLVRHNLVTSESTTLCAAPSITPPILTANHVVYAGLDGIIRLVPLAGGEPILLPTATDQPITAPLAVSENLLCAGSENGLIYIFAAGAAQPDTVAAPEVTRIRSPLTGPLASAKYDWYTNYGDFSGTNANEQGLRPPLRMRWARRLEGTVKHLPVCGGGRLYAHTAEGQVIAFEQDTGRLLWRRYWPDVYLSFTSPLYYRGRLLVPQAGIKRSVMRCLDAATGDLLWEAPFTGSPSWSRQFPPVVSGNLAIYASGSGRYSHQGSEKAFVFRGEPEAAADDAEIMSFIYTNNNPYYPKDNRPLLWAWDLDTGKIVWQRDFSEHGRGGNDCGLCLLDGQLFYSTFFGYSASQKQRRGLPAENNGLTACLDPQTGRTRWLTTDYHVTAKCTLSARDGQLYIGGFNPATEGTQDRYVWCLNADDGKLVWRSDPITSALNVVTVGRDFIFSNALRGRGNVFNRQTGQVNGGVDHNYACCRFTMSGSYILGANMDMIDLADNSRLVSTGPAVDSRECLGAVVSNGRIFYISQASGFMVSQTWGEASAQLPAVWQR